MAYLILSDYWRGIQKDLLTQIISGEYTYLTQDEAASVAEAKSYLVQKYDTSVEFKDTQLYYYYGTYKGRERFYLDATAYSATATYTLHSLTLYNGYVYININTNTPVPEAWNPAHWQILGKQYAIFYIDTINPIFDFYTSYNVGDSVWYKDKTYTCIVDNTGYFPDANPYYWGTGTSYIKSGGDFVGGDAAFVEGDNRSAQLVLYISDILLYHIERRIAPQNIPDLRVKRYDDAIAWLKNAAEGDTITAAIPLSQPNQGRRIRYGSRLPKQNNNF